MELNAVERAIKIEIETRTESKGMGKLGWLMSLTQTTTSPPGEGEPTGTFISKAQLIDRSNSITQ